MSAKNHTLQTVAGLLVAGILVPGLARAQTVSKAAPNTVEFIEAKAQVNLQDRSGFREAARLYLKAAQLREEADPMAVADLMTGAGVLYYSGDKTGARQVFVQAGERALQMGDVARAAFALQRAAVIANEQRDTSRDGLIARAQRLASSPLLSQAERDRILSQFTRAQLASGNH